MTATRLLEEIISDYPRVWEFYKHHNEEKSRNPKFSQRYPLPLGTISMMVDFHKWTHNTTYLVAGTLQQDLPVTVRRTEVGPNPLVLHKLKWMMNKWDDLQRKNKSLAQTLGNEVLDWHTRIRVKVNDGDFYSYDSSIICDGCSHASVMAVNDLYVCVNVACRNPLTGEWRKWQRIMK